MNSPLSEMAVLGFEYGMSSADPRRLVLWEAQFGDFINSAQVIVDQFIAGAESKWQRMSGLTLLLPHGYEGQGPEHSSARLERFLQLCAEDNMQVVNCTTPAQFFHVLRRQMHRPFRKPLIVMSPKSLLRHARAVSSLSDLTDGAFRTVLDDPRVSDPAAVERVLMCAGRIYYALDLGREERARDNIAIVRLEQLYPFPESRADRDPEAVPTRQRVLLGAGGARQSGRARLRRAAHRAPASRPAAPRLRGAPGGGEPRHRLPQDPSDRRERHRRGRPPAASPGAGQAVSLEVSIPPLGESVSEGTIARWLKRDGDTVKADEPLFELETDKATMEIPAPAAGRLEIVEREGATVRVGTVVARIAEAAAAGPRTRAPPVLRPPARSPRQPRCPPSDRGRAAPTPAPVRHSPPRRPPSGRRRRPPLKQPSAPCARRRHPPGRTPRAA